MHARSLSLLGLVLVLPTMVFAQDRPLPKLSPDGTETRYFTSIDGLMDGNADIILKETRRRGTVTAAVLDVCYPAEPGSDRKDRFVVNLAVNGATFTGTTQSIGDKLPVTVRLVRKPTGDTFEFKGRISVGQTVTEVTSTDNSDLSASEFDDSQSTDDGIVAAPANFTEVSPEALAVRVKLDAATGLLRHLRAQNVEVALNSLTPTCEALRAGEQVINVNIDPERAPALLAQLRTMPGVTAAGWSNGTFDLERTIRFPATDWRNGGKLDRDKLAGAISEIAAKTLSAKPLSATWNDRTGKLVLVLKRPSLVAPALGLTDTVELTALAAPDKPGGSDHLLLWLDVPSISTTDEATGPRLGLVDLGADEEDGDDDTGLISALATRFKAQRWDADKSAWK